MIFDLIIEALRLKVIIGILDFERITPQDILIEGVITYEYIHNNFIDYIKIKDVIQNLVQNKKYELLEEALSDITDHLKNNFDTIKNIELKIKKLSITPDCVIGVKINRSF
ncbi:dihydroneopterin aldolase [Helicobacter sp. 13S00482-2]|uniref:dihydroneopterin aldolase n=1 Tax=Helicobacter sp. 13S00482-2 TaxID=1476200 RepID=UPI0015DA2648|nr:dihydroneopterin aldolase [Helicobacter sp. 13S00482-2]